MKTSEMSGDMKIAVRQLRDTLGVRTRQALDMMLARRRIGCSIAEALEQILDEAAPYRVADLSVEPEVFRRRPARSA